jgi:predicted TIM-barrel fold metal-dependent hydrolase
MDVVDAHLHLFMAMSEDYPREVFEAMTPPEREETVEEYLAAMDAAGVDRAVIVPLSPHDRYLGEILQRYPGRFAGVGVFDFGTVDPVADLERRLEVADLQGMRLFGLDGEPGADPEALAVFPLLEAMRAHDMKVWFYGPAEQLGLLDACLGVLPGLTVVMNHLGFLPDMQTELRIDDDRRPQFDVTLPPAGLALVEDIAARHQSVYVHFSGQYAFSAQPHPYRDLQEVVDRVYRAFGADRMLMASDWPWIKQNPGYAQTLSIVDHLLSDISPRERDAIRGGTAMSLFRF